MIVTRFEHPKTQYILIKDGKTLLNIETNCLSAVRSITKWEELLLLVQSTYPMSDDLRIDLGSILKSFFHGKKIPLGFNYRQPYSNKLNQVLHFKSNEWSLYQIYVIWSIVRNFVEFERTYHTFKEIKNSEFWKSSESPYKYYAAYVLSLSYSNSFSFQKTYGHGHSEFSESVNFSRIREFVDWVLDDKKKHPDKGYGTIHTASSTVMRARVLNYFKNVHVRDAFNILINSLEGNDENENSVN